jgi:hypothetical protein
MVGTRTAVHETLTLARRSKIFLSSHATFISSFVYLLLLLLLVVVVVSFA